MLISEIANDKIRIGGRTIENRSPLSLVWTGSYVEFNVKAKECKILIEGPYECYENWIAIEVNGEILSRRMVSREKEWITLFRMMNPDVPTSVRIIKEVQAFSYDSDKEHRLNIYEIELDGELLPIENKKLKIEFIGDSINSAEGCAGAKEDMEWIAQYFSHVRSYPYMIGKKLDADIRVFSQSGWGVYASWDCNCNNVIPKYYEGICSLTAEGFFDKAGFHDRWDFTKWQPDVVVINLGTNDDGAFHNSECENPTVLNMDGEVYVEEDRFKVRDAIVDFLEMVRKNNPKSYIFWAYGILGENMTATILEAMDMYKNKSGDLRVDYIALPDTGEDEFGSRCHPGIKSHSNSAKVIAKAIQEHV